MPLRSLQRTTRLPTCAKTRSIASTNMVMMLLKLGRAQTASSPPRQPSHKVRKTQLCFLLRLAIVSDSDRAKRVRSQPTTRQGGCRGKSATRTGASTNCWGRGWPLRPSSWPLCSDIRHKPESRCPAVIQPLQMDLNGPAVRTPPLAAPTSPTNPIASYTNKSVRKKPVDRVGQHLVGKRLYDCAVSPQRQGLRNAKV